MSDMVVFISSKLNSADKEKIADLMRTHKIKITTDINNATVIIEPTVHNTNDQKLVIAITNKTIATLEDIAEQLVAEIQGQLFQLKQNISMNIPDIIDAPVIISKKSHHHKQHLIKQSQHRFNEVKHIHNNKIFNRTKCK
ncbi:MAG: hypothetical protein J5608_00615 [Alphaproteobacteria bacterium]|nr:hypothetical protein [Alphaproteobacteria bacterium]